MASIMQRFLFSVSTVSARNAWHNDPPPPFCVLNMTKNALQIMSLAAYASETNNQQDYILGQEETKARLWDKMMLGKT